MSLAPLGVVLVLARAYAGPAARPDGDPPGHGSQRLATDATQMAHIQFNGDACVVAAEVVAMRRPDPALPMEDSFSFSLRSPMLNKVRWDLRICLPAAASPVDPRCKGEWESSQAKADGPVKCLPGRPADTGEVLAVAAKHGLPKPPVDGLRLALRAVPKSGKGMARDPKLKGKTVWLVESRDQCQAFDAATLAPLYKGGCGKLGWPEK
ncbi:MAG: hypothetical protein HY553_04980 [Elusimicrobia bacterium]|nr:hypothetical protein [Elusimicrobiota bacterium]